MNQAPRTNVPKPGAHRDVTFGQYVQWDAINWHTLEPFRVSSLAGRHAVVTGEDATTSQVLGEAFHCAILEPQRFDADFAAMPRFEGNANSNAYKAAKAEWISANDRKTHIMVKERDALLIMADAVKKNAVASKLLAAKGRNEFSIAWADAETGELCKGRVDRLCLIPAGVIHPGASRPNDLVLCLIDLKTTIDPTPHEFERQAAKYAYHGQAAFYLDGLRTLEPASITPVIIAVQNQAPWDVVVHVVSDDAIEHGRRLYRRLMRMYTTGIKSGAWPGSCASVHTLHLPNWAKETEEDK